MQQFNDATGAPPPTNGLAIAAFCCGLVGMCIPGLGLAALIMGIIATNQIRDAMHERGRGMAITAIVLGAIGLFVPFIALGIGIMLPALGEARRTARQMQNGTQIRGIHQALILDAQGNSTWFPGFDRNGNPSATNVEDRLQILLDSGHFTAPYLISPSETKTPAAAGTQLTTVNYSYALLQLPDDGGRHAEWRQTNNAQAIAVSDRLITDRNGQFRSVHTNKPGTWRGSMGWNDNHASFEPGFTVNTRYDKVANANDDIFAPAGDDDAYMVYSGND